jgi:selenide, water dikinase
METVPRLTDMTSAGGCSAKYSAAQLEQLLKGFLPAESEDLLVGLDPADDAAVYRLDDERAIVFTLDFFPPIVDDPGDFGTIAATNALNDVFAMGGTPLLALSIAAFPEELDVGAVAAIFAGADRQVRAAGAILAGGHTIRDDEPKYGLAVVGTVHPQGLWPKAGAQPGDAVFLTKPLGTALVLGGFRKGLLGSAQLDAAVEWMKTLNRDAAEALRPFEPSCVTDVTGFGLLGHAHEVAGRSGVRVVLDAARIPALDGALEVSRAGVRNAGHPRNEEFAGPSVTVEDSVLEEVVGLAYDPQTSGGLLVTLPADRGVGLEAEFASRGLFLQRVGRVEAGSGVVLAG